MRLCLRIYLLSVAIAACLTSIAMTIAANLPSYVHSPNDVEDVTMLWLALYRWLLSY